MQPIKESNHESDYYELLSKLERANENLAYLKNNKEICVRDLHKYNLLRLELENSALAEENDYLKKKIKHVEKNVSLMLSKSIDDITNSEDMAPVSVSFTNVKGSAFDSHYKVNETDRVINDKFIRPKYSVPPLPGSNQKDFENATTNNTYRKKRKVLNRSIKSSRSITSSISRFDIKETAMFRSMIPYYF